MDVVRGEIGKGCPNLGLEFPKNFSACHEGVNDEGVARETLVSLPLTLSVQRLLSASRAGTTDNLCHAEQKIFHLCTDS